MKGCAGAPPGIYFWSFGFRLPPIPLRKDMTMRSSIAFLASAAVLFAAAALPAQSVVVDYTDSNIGSYSGQYPIYTGTGTTVIRGQLFCPATFAGMPTQPMICSRIGVQLAEPPTGPVPYVQFIVRAGATTVPALTNTWATNLPDQRVQVNLSGQTIKANPASTAWVEYALRYPFHWQPGQGVVLDIISQAAVAGTYLRTAIGTNIPRLIDTNFAGNPTGPTLSTSGGIKFRMVFEPLGLVAWGSGCPGSGNIVPAIGSQGQPTLGSNNFLVTLSKALGGSAAIFMVGMPIDLPVGGGCSIYNNMLLLFSSSTTGSGPGNGTAAFPLFVPNNPVLLKAVVDVQWAVMDPASPLLAPLVFSAGGKVVIF